MTFSIKKIFSKKEDNSKAAEKDNSTSKNAPENDSDKTVKNDRPAGCCGSCS